MALILAWVKKESLDKVAHDIQFMVNPDDVDTFCVTNDHVLIKCRNKLALDIVDHIYDKWKDDLRSIKCQIYGNWRPNMGVEE